MRYITSQEQITPMLMVLVDWLSPTTSHLYPCLEMYSCCSGHLKTPVTAAQIRQWTDTDSILSRMRRNVLSGWVASDEPEMQSYQSRATELSVQDGCLLWGSRVVVPKKGREAVISLLHEGHPGVTRMKRLARRYMWWPGIDKALEFAVRTCAECQENQKLPTRALMHPWEWPETSVGVLYTRNSRSHCLRQWYRLHQRGIH